MQQYMDYIHTIKRSSNQAKMNMRHWIIALLSISIAKALLLSSIEGLVLYWKLGSSNLNRKQILALPVTRQH